ncbi:MAG: hypothetical protein J5970_01490 [Bacilli bacterium]|nr:hypothetical protein [Bacilli bacterium]
MNLRPINELIDDFNNLKKNESSNKEKLILKQKEIKDQMAIINKIDRVELEEKINNSEDNSKYIKIKNEMTKYNNYRDELNRIINEDLESIVKDNKKSKDIRKIINKHKVKILITAGVSLAILSIGAIVINKNKNDGRVDNYTENGTTEFRTEEPTEASTMEVAEATTETTTEATTEKKTEATTEATTSTTESTTEATTTETIESELIDQDKIDTATDWFWKMNDGIDKAEETIMDDDKREEANDTAKQKVIEYTDFIFYGTEIDGKTFEQLTDEEKSKVYNKYQELINTVNEKDPNYINNMSDRYKVVKDFGSLTLNNAKEKIKEKVGEEYYNSAGETKDAVKEGVKDTGSLGLKFIKDKYEEWRDKNKDE